MMFYQRFAWIFLIVNYFTVIIIVNGKFTITTSNPELKGMDPLELHIRRRHRILQQLALTALSDKSIRPPHCPLDRIVFPDKLPYGQSGNILISLTHALWIGRKINATVIIPVWMEPLFIPFDTTFFRSIYCISYDRRIPPNAKVTNLHSSESFYGFGLLRLLPERLTYPFTSDWQQSYNSPLILELSRHFIQVYTALWSNPVEEIFELITAVIKAFFGSSFGYTGVHIRNFEGICHDRFRMMNDDPTFRDLPFNLTEWLASPGKPQHPLCSITPSFLMKSFALHHRHYPNLSNTFIACDGQTDIESFRQVGGINLGTIQEIVQNLTEGIPLNQTVLAYYSPQLNLTPLYQLPYHFRHLSKYLDMILLMHANFCVLNPISTVSLQVYLIRMGLGLESIPFIRNNDIFQLPLESLIHSNRSLWVSHFSLLEAMTTL